MKTTRELNEKIWYRLLKVIYIILFLGIIATVNSILFSNGTRNINLNKTEITCLIGNKSQFTADNKNIYLSKDDFENEKFDYKKFFESYNDSTIAKILSACSPNNVEIESNKIYEYQKFFELKLDDYLNNSNIPEEKLKEVIKVRDALSFNKSDYLDYSRELFSIHPVFTYYEFIKNFLIANFIIILAFEAVKRVFYYIALGTLRPKKQ